MSVWGFRRVFHRTVELKIRVKVRAGWRLDLEQFNGFALFIRGACSLLNIDPMPATLKPGKEEKQQIFYRKVQGGWYYDASWWCVSEMIHNFKCVWLDQSISVILTDILTSTLDSWYLLRKVPGDLPGSLQARSSRTNLHKGILTPEEQWAQYDPSRLLKCT